MLDAFHPMAGPRKEVSSHLVPQAYPNGVFLLWKRKRVLDLITVCLTSGPYLSLGLINMGKGRHAICLQTMIVLRCLVVYLLPHLSLKSYLNNMLSCTSPDCSLIMHSFRVPLASDCVWRKRKVQN